MSQILVADLHLTSVARDEYRWRLFPWLKDELAKHNAELFILGDLTEAKNYHSSDLVNRIVDALKSLDAKVRIVPGNHDAVDVKLPYFRFLRHYDFVTYYETPFMCPVEGRQVFFLPHSKDFVGWESRYLQDAEFIFMHQTWHGSVSETGHVLDAGEHGKQLEHVLKAARRAQIWSGDIHVPQKAGPVNYVGAPYPIRFGDAFQPRAVLMAGGMRHVSNLTPPRFGRHHVTLFSDFTSLRPLPQMQPGDQARYTIRLKRSEFGEWGRISALIKKACQETEVELCGLEVERIADESLPAIRKRGEGKLVSKTPEQVLGEWCAKQSLEKPIVDAGLEILRTVAG